MVARGEISGTKASYLEEKLPGNLKKKHTHQAHVVKTPLMPGAGAKARLESRCCAILILYKLCSTGSEGLDIPFADGGGCDDVDLGWRDEHKEAIRH